jgi:ankyrin repeat protein
MLLSKLLNLNKCFEHPVERELVFHETLPEDWLEKFCDIVAQNLDKDHALLKASKTHPTLTELKSRIIYSHLSEDCSIANALKDALQFLYQCMVEKDLLSKDEIMGIAQKIAEGVPQCSAGMLERGCRAVCSIKNEIDNLQQYLYNFRFALVLRAAYQRTNDVHRQNRFFTVAGRMGLVRGISGDEALGALPDNVIEQDLVAMFESHYTPINILIQLTEMLKVTLIKQGLYNGLSLEEEYGEHVYGKWAPFLEEMVKHPVAYMSPLQMNKEGDGVVDFNWSFVHFHVFRFLFENGIFQGEHAEALLSYLATLIEGKTLALKEAVFPKKSIELLCPTPKDRVTFQSLFPVLGDEGITALWSPYREDVIREDFLVSVLSSNHLSLKEKNSELQKLWALSVVERKSRLAKPTHAAETDLLTACVYVPECMATLIGFLDELMSEAEKIAYLEHQTEKGWTLLEFAANYRVGALATICPFISGLDSKTKGRLLGPSVEGRVSIPMLLAAKNPEGFAILNELIASLDEDDREKLLSYSDRKNRNVLMIAAAENPQAIVPVCILVAELSFDTRLKLLSDFDVEKGLNALMYAVRYQEEAIQPICQLIDAFETQMKLAILNKSSLEGQTALMIAAQHSSTATKLLCQYIEGLEAQEKVAILTRTDASGWSALMLAVANPSFDLQPFYKIIDTLEDKSQLNDLFTKPNENGVAILTVAAKQNIRALTALFHYIHAMLDFFNIIPISQTVEVDSLNFCL